MWQATTQNLARIAGQRISLNFAGRAATYEQVLTGWRDDERFRTLFSELLASAPYRAFRWETPSVTTASLTQPFECVLVDEPPLARAADRRAFAEHFTSETAWVATFGNLGGDATMVVPCPRTDVAAYVHLAAFVRLAPDEQQQALWQAIADAMLRRVSTKPVWLSTAGAGVAWLHVRLDDRPKYYAYAPYRA